MIPVYVLLFFAAWTLLTLTLGVGISRWSLILGGKASLSECTATNLDVGGDFYRRTMRAHANCVENLPVYASLVLVMWIMGERGGSYDMLAIAVAIGRVMQTVTHLAFRQTDRIVLIRFTFFSVQLLAMLGIGGLLVAAGLAGS